jgi:hypothetical protein
MVTQGPVTFAEASAVKERLERYLRELNRNPRRFEFEYMVSLANWRTRLAADPTTKRGIDMEPEGCAEKVASWAALGATHVCFNTMDAGFARVDDHLKAMRRFTEAVRNQAIGKAG